MMTSGVLGRGDSSSKQSSGNQFVAPGSVFSSIREIPSNLSTFVSCQGGKTTLKVAATVSLLLPTVIGLMSGSSWEETFLPNPTHCNHTTISHAISDSSSLQLSTTCVQNVAFATFGMLFAQNTWSLGSLGSLFDFYTPLKAQATPLQEHISSTVVTQAVYKTEKPNPRTSDMPICAMGLLALATGQIPIQLAGIPLLIRCLNVPGVRADLRQPFPASLSLADLNGTNGFNITGINPSDGSGYSVSSAGDVNADGIADLIIGANGANNDIGASYVVFGSKQIGSQGTLSLADLNGLNGFKIPGITPNGESGASVSSAGDVNADGIADLIIGAFVANNERGASYVVFGSKQLGSQGTLSLADLNGLNGFSIPGINPNDYSGNSVSSAGDVNADGIADLIIGGYGANKRRGASYVVFGSKQLVSQGTLKIADLNGANGFNIMGINPYEASGSSVSSAGDVNADGIADLLIGAPGANNERGASYVVFGRNYTTPSSTTTTTPFPTTTTAASTAVPTAAPTTAAPTTKAPTVAPTVAPTTTPSPTTTTAAPTPRHYPLRHHLLRRPRRITRKKTSL